MVDRPGELKPWTLNAYSHSMPQRMVLARCEEMEALVSRLWKAEPSVRQAYTRAALPYLQDKSPQVRAAACELLAHLPSSLPELDALETVATLLDDPTVAFRGVVRELPTTGNPQGKETPLALTVHDMAQLVLVYATGCRFPDCAAFVIWWAENREYRHRLWYWARAFKGTPEQIAFFDALPEGEALRRLLLMDNPVACQAECEHPWRSRGLPVPNQLYWRAFPNMRFREMEAFVKRLELKGALLDVLEGKTVYTELQDTSQDVRLKLSIIEGRKQLGRDVSLLLSSCMAPGDAPRLEAILNSDTSLLSGDTTLQIRLAEQLMRLLPDRREEILVDQVTRHPKLYEFIRQLVSSTGLKHDALFQRLYNTVWDATAQMTFISALAGRRTPECRKRLIDLFYADHLEADLDKEGCPTEADRARYTRLYGFAEAARLLNDFKPLVVEKTIRAAAPVYKPRNEQDQARLAAFPAARKQAIELLTAFYQKLAVP
ncbi:MAG: hypothetical protein ACYC7E_16930 [Armatimonadota bacterium]